jgi:RimJ/RimL family protein N-acetyltransferase
MTPPTLTTARLTLGPITPAHAEAFIAFCATGASRFIGGPAEARDAWEGAAICAGLWALRGFGPFWVSDAAGQPVGRVGPYFPIWRTEPELTWVIYPAHQGKGYATEAALAARDWCDHQGLAPMVSLIDEDNAASLGVARRLRAVYEAPHPLPDSDKIHRWRHPAGGRA